MTEDTLLQHLLDIKDRLGSLEAKLDATIADYRQTRDRVEGIEEAQNSLKWFASGAAAVFSVIFSTVLAFLHGAK